MSEASYRGCAGALASLVLLIAIAWPAHADDRHDFLVELDGTFGEFVMYCRLIDDGAGKTIRLREYLPESYRIQAEAVSCTVNLLEIRGRISGKLFSDGRLIASASQNAIRPVIKLRSDGPWGKARGARTSIPIHRPRSKAEPK